MADQIAPPSPLFAVVLSVGGAGFIFAATYPAHAQIRDALRAGSFVIPVGAYVRIAEVNGSIGRLEVASDST